MAKKGKSSPSKSAPAAPANVEPEVAKKIVELKTEGNNSFARGDYQKALTVYDEAIKLLPSNAPERADFHNNKAACYIGQKRYKEAVKECTSALEVAPNSVRALQRRAKAFEHQGLFKQALADVMTINKTDNASPETQEQERKLREAAARRPASAANGAVGSAAAGAGAGLGRSSVGAGSGASKLAALQQGLYVAKCSLGDDIKLVHLSLTNNYADVLAAVQAKFPNAGPFALKYMDKNGDLLTLTCKADIHVALTELMQQYQRQVAAQGSHGPRLAAAFPPLRLVLSPVASPDDVPKPPLEEEFERLAAQRAAQQAATDRSKAGDATPSGATAPGAGEELHLDSWLVDFAQLFIQQTGLEPDKHVDLHNMGWDAVTKALDATIHADAAVPLFDKAKDNFRDVACTGLASWGQVHQLLGQRALEAAAKAGKAVEEVRPAVLAEYAEAEKRYREALAYNADFFDAVCNMSQLEFERCKLAAGLMAVDTKSSDNSAASTSEASTSEASTSEASTTSAPGKATEQAAADPQEALNAATRAALSSLKAEAVQGALALFEGALTWADKAVALAPVMDAKQKEAQAKAAESGQPQPPTPAGEYDFKAQALVLKGNFIYEWSQMLAAVGGEWRAELDRAVALFREAGCPEKDIRVALRNHFKAAELDIPADEPEAETAKEEAAAAAPAKEAAKTEPAEEKPKAKGLPSLEVKKAKK